MRRDIIHVTAHAEIDKGSIVMKSLENYITAGGSKTLPKIRVGGAWDGEGAVPFSDATYCLVALDVIDEVGTKAKIIATWRQYGRYKLFATDVRS